MRNKFKLLAITLGLVGILAVPSIGNENHAVFATEETTLSATFKTSGKSADSGTGLDTKAAGSDIFEDGNTLFDNEAPINSISKGYLGKTGTGLKFGSSKAGGSVVFNLVKGAQTGISSISVETLVYGSDSTTLTFTLGSSGSMNTIGTQTAGTTFSYKPSTTASGTLFGISSDKRFYLTSISFTFGEIETHTLSFDPNGGTGTAPEALSGAVGSEITVPQNTYFTAPSDDKVFKEWNSQADGTGTSYLPNSKYTVTNQDATLYAIWKDKTLDPNADNKFSLVTSISQVSSGDSIVFVVKDSTNAETSKINGYKNTSANYLDVETISVYDNSVNVDSTKTLVFKLESVTGTSYYYLVTSDNKKLYIPEAKKLALGTGTDDTYQWSFDLENEAVVLRAKSYSTYGRMCLNGTRIAPYPTSSAGISPVSIYKRSAAIPKLQLTYSEKNCYVGKKVTIGIKEIKNITPTSYAWTLNNTKASIDGATDENEVKILCSEEGTCEVTLTINGTYTAKCVLTILPASEQIVTEGNYFITNSGYMLGADLTRKAYDPSSLSDMWTFTLAEDGDNTYYITNGTNYLAHGRYQKSNAAEQSLGLTTTSDDAWTISKSQDGSYLLKSSYSTTSHSAYYLSLGGDNVWHASYSNIATQKAIGLSAAASFLGITYTGTLTKSTYNVGDTFDSTGLSFFASYDNGVNVPITATITWNTIEQGSTATGFVNVGGSEKTVTVTGLTITNYLPDSLAVNVTDSNTFKTQYYVGESVDLTGADVVLTKRDNNASPQTITETLSKTDYIVNPTIIQSNTTKVEVSLKDDSSIKTEFNITLLERSFVAANYVKVGDEIVIATLDEKADHTNTDGGEELTSNNGTITHTHYEYTPSGYDTFTVGAGASEGTFSLQNKRTGQYLKGEQSTFGYKQRDSITSNYDLTFTYYLTYLDNNYNLTFGNVTEDDGNYELNITSYSTLVGDYTKYFTGECILLDDGTGNIEIQLWNGTDFETVLNMDVEWELDGGCFVIYKEAQAETVDASSSWLIDFDKNTGLWDLRTPAQDEANKKCIYNCDSTGKFGFYVPSNVQNGKDIVIYRNNSIALANKCTGITIDTTNAKTSYTVGDNFQWTDIEVTAYYEGGISSIVPIGGFNISVPDMSTAGQKTITVTYGALDNIVTNTFKITVTDPEAETPYLTSAAFATNPTKTVFEEGDTFVFDGTIRGYFSDGSNRLLEESEYTVVTPSMAIGKRNVVINIPTGKGGEPIKLTYGITVVEKPVVVTLTSLRVTGQKTTFELGDEFEFGGKCYAVYSDNSEKEVNPKFSTVDMSTTGTKTVTVSYKEDEVTVSTTYDIVVNEKVYIVDMKAEGYTTEFTVGDAYNFDGVVKYAMSNDPTNYKVTGSYDVDSSAYQADKPGTYTIKITSVNWEGEITFDVVVHTVEVNEIVLQYTSSKNAKVGGTGQLVLKKPFSTYDDREENEVWTNFDITSSDENIATVDEYGKITYNHIGTCTITVSAKYGTGTATYAVTVYGNTTAVSLENAAESMHKGEELTLVPTLTGAELEDEPVTYSSSDESVATVDENGKVTALKAGTTTITVTSCDGTVTTTCEITVYEPIESLAFAKEEETIYVGDNLTLSVTVNPEGASEEVTYSSDDETIAKIENGVLIALKEGDVTITATSDDDNSVTDTMVVHVLPTDVTSISLDKESATLEVNDELQLTATINPTNAKNNKVTWSTSDSKVATVDQNGKVTAVGNGTVTITAKSESGVTATCTITVHTSVTSVSLDQDNISLEIGEDATLVATVNPSSASNTNVTYSVTDKDGKATTGLTVDQNGKVTAVSAGEYIVTVTTEEGSFTATCTVKVAQRAESVSTSESEKALFVGDTYDIVATVSPENAVDKSLTYSSSNTSVATVDENGKVTAVGNGTTVITVSTENGKTTEVTITVTTPVTGVSLDKTTLSMDPGTDATLVATINPSTASNNNVSYSVTDGNGNPTTGLTVDQNGKVHAVISGSYIVTVTTEDGGYTATCEVTVNVLVESVTLGDSEKALFTGDEYQINATIAPENATNKTLTYVSSDASVATVDENGKVVAVGNGTATITVTSSNGVEATVVVTVTTKVTGVSLNHDTLTIDLGSSASLEATINPTTASNQEVTYSVTDMNGNATTGLTVSNDGTIYGAAQGSYKVTVTTSDGGYTDTCIVIVIKHVEEVSVDVEVKNMYLGKVYQIDATVTPSDASDTSLTYSSNNTSVATVDANGKVTAVGEGAATITITSVDGGKTATIIILVTKQKIRTGCFGSVGVISGIVSLTSLVGVSLIAKKKHDKID